MTIQEPVLPPRKRRQKPADDAKQVVIPISDTMAERILVSCNAATAELQKLNTAMDKLLGATGEAVIPAVHELADKLIAFLDTADDFDEREEENEHGDGGYGEGGADDEPSLGASETMNQERAWRNTGSRDDCELQDEDGDELDKLEACDLDISGEADGATGGCVDDEPSLGSLDSRVSQLRWSAPDRPVLWPNQDMELDEAEHEVGIEDLPHDAKEGV
jgi:hypothetical protein